VPTLPKLGTEVWSKIILKFGSGGTGILLTDCNGPLFTGEAETLIVSFL